MKYEIELEAFEGPMDLLLHLINDEKIDIYDIPINSITEKFLVYIEDMESLNLEVASDFLVMASTLIEIKSKMLLPKPKLDVDEEEIDPRSELVTRLIEYKKYKEVSVKLKELETVQSKVYYKPKEEIEIVEDIVLEDMEMEVLLRSISNIIKNRTKEEKHSIVDHIQREEYTVEGCMHTLRKDIEKKEELSFTSLLSLNTTREEIITYFLALLELVKIKLVTVKEDENLSDLIIKRRDDDGFNR